MSDGATGPGGRDADTGADTDAAGDTDATTGDPAVAERDLGDCYTVRELNRAVERAVDVAGLDDVRVVGEVTDRSETNTALYFTLTDGDGVEGDCEIDCVLWQSRYRSLPVTVENGDEVVLTGSVDYWVEGGRLNLKPHQVLTLGEGARARRIAQLRAELEERGWFDDARKRAPPRYPDRVGVVTSRDGDARHDIETSIHERNPTVDVVLRHATVQGEDAPTDIADGIHHLDRHTDVDAIVVGRGGGSETDLAAFDTEAVAEAIFTCETPVVAAVGHAEDETVAGAVADVDAITPTDAGDVVAPLDRLADRVDTLAERLGTAADRAVDRRLTALADRLDDAHGAAVGDTLRDLERRLGTAHAQHGAAELQRLATALDAGYESHRSRRLATLENDLAAAYERATLDRVDRLERRLESAHARQVDRTLTELSGAVEAGYQQAVQAQTHRTELRRQRTRYRLAIAALVALLLALVVAVVLV